MSLINQMLRDLQQQKGAGKQPKKSLQPRVMERIPYLPLPVMLGGGALLLLCFVWWLAGVLADVMFDYESAEQTVAVETVAPKSDPVEASVPLEPEEDQLTEDERNAEPPVARIDEAREALPEPVREPEVKPVIKTVTKKPVAGAPKKVIVKKSVSPLVRESATRTDGVVIAAKRPVRKPPAPSRPEVVVQAPARLHPDDLPGALPSPARKVAETNTLKPRPNRLTASTPYGMAEEAYLDGKWARIHERTRLAIRSLQDALELYPGHLQARELLVEILAQEEKAGEAMALLSEGLEIAPDYVVFKKSYARMLADQGDFDAAIKVLLKGGMPSVSEEPESHVVLASLYQRLDEPFLAAQTYRNLLVSWPGTGAFWVGLGGALEGQNLSTDAAQCYKKALQTKNLRQDLANFARKRLSVLN